MLSFSRYKVAVTKHKDLEQTSSSLYSQNNIWTPAVDFSKYIEDNESIEDEVSLEWTSSLKTSALLFMIVNSDRYLCYKGMYTGVNSGSEL